MGSLSGEVTVLVVLLALVLVMRWVFAPPARRRRARPVDAAESSELGLLRVIASELPRSEAMRRRTILGEDGIRSSMSGRSDGRYDVLVFHADVDRARSLLEP
jgi:hypothetical protein